MILVTGGAGVMGTQLVKGLIERGFEVRVLDRPGTSIEGVDVDMRHGDVSDPKTLEGAFEGVDTVYHLAAVIIAHDPSVFQIVNTGGTRNMVEGAIAAGVKHFVFVSSASVLYPFTTPYSESKRECERIVSSQTAMKYTIIRPTLSYNEYGGLEFRMFLDYLERFPVVPFIGTGKSLKNPVHVDDLLKGFLAVAGNPNAYNKTYNFSGGEEISIWDLAKLMLRHRGKQRPFVPIPVWACKVLARGMALVMEKPPLTWNVIAGIIQDANLDHSNATQDLGYEPIGIHQGLEQIWPMS
jgi:NADH dehydrogenase